MSFIIDQNKKKKTKPEYDVPFILRWPSLKPFVNGGLAAFLQGLTLYVPFAAIYYSPLLSPIRRSPRFLGFNILAKSCPDGIVIRTLSTSLQLGLFETLRNKAIATNDGMALTLYQEAACGLIAGAAEAYFSFPFVSACLPQVDPTTLSVVQRAKYRNIFDAFYSMSANRKISALWTNAGPYVKTRMGTNVGMLASYNPSLCYLRDSCGLSETRAQLGASAVSAFFGATCSVPVKNVLAQGESGSSLDCALKILKSRGPLAFFSGFSRQFALVGPPIMILWFAYENVRKL
ncbi:putative mitochondrial carrier domain-containing protein [Rosa chinensis]|uniref:Putative mitochondrial carrier domain-containing protein n=1 Tax=Rosa chinensis TaxID=74649 RepID=A0A2P6QNM9_ROSCH|nr:mitochondrial dicarboxylate/tricarboxylate transporter DTC [Rosa chinensis]PRQ35776.1 putative mitochondrial carrier domain-containing protein [Rosa chinensis]